jgi:hypothetical protein
LSSRAHRVLEKPGTVAIYAFSKLAAPPSIEKIAIENGFREAQRAMIAELFGYRLWLADFLPQLAQRIAQIIRRDVTPGPDSFQVGCSLIVITEFNTARLTGTEAVRVLGTVLGNTTVPAYPGLWPRVQGNFILTRNEKNLWKPL